MIAKWLIEIELKIKSERMLFIIWEQTFSNEESQWPKEQDVSFQTYTPSVDIATFVWNL